MYINDYKIHRCHNIHNQVQSFHDFVDGVIGPLSSSNHHRALSQRTSGDPVFKLVNDKSNALVHEVVQIGRVTGHLCHHTNLKKPRKNESFVQPHHHNKNSLALTDNR